MGRMIAVRRKVWNALLQSPEDAEKLACAKTTADIEKVVVDFCKKRGIRVVDLDKGAR